MSYFFLYKKFILVIGWEEKLFIWTIAAQLLPRKNGESSPSSPLNPEFMHTSIGSHALSNGFAIKFQNRPSISHISMNAQEIWATSMFFLCSLHNLCVDCKQEMIVYAENSFHIDLASEQTDQELKAESWMRKTVATLVLISTHHSVQIYIFFWCGFHYLWSIRLKCSLRST